MFVASAARRLRDRDGIGGREGIRQATIERIIELPLAHRFRFPMLWAALRQVALGRSIFAPPVPLVHHSSPMPIQVPPANPVCTVPGQHRG